MAKTARADEAHDVLTYFDKLKPGDIPDASYIAIVNRWNPGLISPDIDMAKQAQKIFDYVAKRAKDAQDVSDEANERISFLLSKTKEAVDKAVDRGDAYKDIPAPPSQVKGGYLSVTTTTGRIIKSIALDDVDDAIGLVPEYRKLNESGELAGQIATIQVRDDINGRVLLDDNNQRMEWRLQPDYQIVDEAPVAEPVISRRLPISLTTTRDIARLTEYVSNLSSGMVAQGRGTRWDAVQNLKGAIEGIPEDYVPGIDLLRSQIDAYQKLPAKLRRKPYSEIQDTVSKLSVRADALQFRETLATASIEAARGQRYWRKDITSSSIDIERERVTQEITRLRTELGEASDRLTNQRQFLSDLADKLRFQGAVIEDSGLVDGISGVVTLPWRASDALLRDKNNYQEIVSDVRSKQLIVTGLERQLRTAADALPTASIEREAVTPSPDWWPDGVTFPLPVDDNEVDTLVSKLSEILLDEGVKPKNLSPLAIRRIRLNHLMTAVHALPQDIPGKEKLYNSISNHIAIIDNGTTGFTAPNVRTKYWAAAELAYQDVKEAIDEMPGIVSRDAEELEGQVGRLQPEIAEARAAGQVTKESVAGPDDLFDIRDMRQGRQRKERWKIFFKGTDNDVGALSVTSGPSGAFSEYTSLGHAKRAANTLAAKPENNPSLPQYGEWVIDRKELAEEFADRALTGRKRQVPEARAAEAVVTPRPESVPSPVPAVDELRQIEGESINDWYGTYMGTLRRIKGEIETRWQRSSSEESKKVWREDVLGILGIDVSGMTKKGVLDRIKARARLSVDKVADNYLAMQYPQPPFRMVRVGESRRLGVQTSGTVGGVPTPTTVMPESLVEQRTKLFRTPKPNRRYQKQALSEKNVTDSDAPEYTDIPVRGNTQTPINVVEQGKRISTDNFEANYYTREDGVGDPPGSVHGWAISRSSVGGFIERLFHPYGDANMPLDGTGYVFQKHLEAPVGPLEEVIEGVWYVPQVFTKKSAAHAKLVEMERLFQAHQVSDLQPGDILPIGEDGLQNFDTIYIGRDPANSKPSYSPKPGTVYETKTAGDKPGVIARDVPQGPAGPWPPTAEGAGEPPIGGPLSPTVENMPKAPTPAQIRRSNNMWKSRHPENVDLSFTERLRQRTARDWWRDAQKMFSDVYADANMTEREFGKWWMDEFGEPLPADRRPGMNAALHRGSPVAAQARTDDLMRRIEQALGPGNTRHGYFNGTISVDDLNDYMDAMHMMTVYKMHPERQNKRLGLTIEDFDIQLRWLGKYSQEGEKGFTGSQSVADKRIMYARLETAGEVITSEYRKMLNERVVEGLVKPELANKVNAMYPYYHPLKYIESPSFQATWNPAMGSRIVGATDNDMYHLAKIGDVEQRFSYITNEWEIVPKPIEDVVGMLGKTILHHELSITINRTSRAYIRAMEHLPTFGPGRKFERKGTILRVLPADAHPVPTRMVDTSTGRNVWQQGGKVWETMRGGGQGEYVWEPTGGAARRAPISEEGVPPPRAGEGPTPPADQEMGIFSILAGDYYEAVIKDQADAHKEVMTAAWGDGKWVTTGQYVTGTATRTRAQRMYPQISKEGMAKLPKADPDHIYMQFWEHGEPIIYQVPKEAGVLMAHLSRFDRSTVRRVTDFLQNPARWGITAYNPAFMAMQWVVETMNLAVVHGISPIASAKTLMEVALDFGGNNPEYKEMVRNRGLSLGVTGKGIARTTEDLMKGRISIRNESDWKRILGNATNLVTGPATFLGHTAEIFETAPRLTAYKAYLQRYKKQAYDRAYDMAELEDLKVTRPGPGYRKGMASSREHIEKKADKAVFNRLDYIKQSAAYEARTALVDYQRWGHAIHLADSVFLYLNAGVQGALAPLRYALRPAVSQTGKFFERRPFQTKIAAGLSGLLAMNEAVVLWNHQVSNDCNNYYDIPASDRIGGMVILLPGCGEYDEKYGKYRPRYIKLWPARELALFTGPQTYMMEAILGGEHGFDFMQMLGGMGGEINPLHSVIPTESRGGKLGIPGVPVPTHIGSLGVDLMNNWNSFYNREIVPDEMKDLPVKDQYTSRTSTLARRVGDALNISPMHIDHGLNWGVYKDVIAGAGWFLESIDPSTPHPYILVQAHSLHELRNSVADNGGTLNIKGREQNIGQLEREFLAEVGRQLHKDDFTDGIARPRAVVEAQIIAEANKLAEGQRKPWDSITDRFYRTWHWGGKEQAQRTAERDYGIDSKQQTNANHKIRTMLTEQKNDQWMQDAALESFIAMKSGSREISVTPSRWRGAQQADSTTLSAAILDIAEQYPKSSYSMLAGSPDRLKYDILMGSVLNNWADPSTRGQLLYLMWRTAYDNTQPKVGEKERIAGDFDVSNDEPGYKGIAITDDNRRPIYEAQDVFIESLSDKDKSLLDHARQVNMTDIQKRWYNDKAKMKKYWTADRAILDGIKDKGDHAIWRSYLLGSSDDRRALKDNNRIVIDRYMRMTSQIRSAMLNQDKGLRNTLAFWGYLNGIMDYSTDDRQRYDFHREGHPGTLEPNVAPKKRDFPSAQEFPRIPQSGEYTPIRIGAGVAR